ncbi:4255_t:CDS:2 [Dentiscutata erythropus]|uniref:4255_t:CDS:1 n=1 Tax=Dentiscutata erythropus TaxID=1348616 RepID=A0A9N9G259_9GLOM|nr:4255_t:CDS:2 [Dentiscutata erythropus]
MLFGNGSKEVDSLKNLASVVEIKDWEPPDADTDSKLAIAGVVAKSVAGVVARVVARVVAGVVAGVVAKVVDGVVAKVVAKVVAEVVVEVVAKGDVEIDIADVAVDDGTI